jgi:hypothetical protein
MTCISSGVHASYCRTTCHTSNDATEQSRPQGILLCTGARLQTGQSRRVGDTSNRAATSTGSTAYSHTCAASQHWKLICAYSCAHAVADHGCNQQTSGLSFLYDQTVTASRRRPAVTPRSLVHVACAGIGIFSRYCRTSRRRQKRQVAFMLSGISMGRPWKCWARITGSVLAGGS